MTPDEIKAIVIKFLEEPWNKGNVDVIDEVCAPEYTVRFDPSGWGGGREDLKKAVLDYRKNSPDASAKLINIIIEGERVAYEWEMSRTVEGKLEKSMGVTFLKFKDGKIIEDRFVAADVEETQPSA